LSAGARVGRGRAGPGRRAETVHPGDQRPLAAVGRLLLVRAAVTWTRPTKQAFCGPRETSGTGWARATRPTVAAWTCYVRGRRRRQRRTATCCTPASGHRCCTTWATSLLVSRPFRRLFQPGLHPGPTRYSDERRAAGTSRRSRSRDRGRPLTSSRGGRSAREYGKMGKSLRKTWVDPRTRCATGTARTPSGSTRCRWGRWMFSRPWETRAVVGAPTLSCQRVLAGGHRRADRPAAGWSTAPADEQRPTGLPAQGHRRGSDRTWTGCASTTGPSPRLIELTQPDDRGWGAEGTPRELAEPLGTDGGAVRARNGRRGAGGKRLGHDGTITYVDFPIADPTLLKGRVGDLPGAGQR